MPEGAPSLDIVVVHALCDPSLCVRQEALVLFNGLARILGAQFLRFVVPQLLNSAMDLSAAAQDKDQTAVESLVAQSALDGLYSVLETRPNLVS